MGGLVGGGSSTRFFDCLGSFSLGGFSFQYFPARWFQFPVLCRCFKCTSSFSVFHTSFLSVPHILSQCSTHTFMDVRMPQQWRVAPSVLWNAHSAPYAMQSSAHSTPYAMQWSARAYAYERVMAY
eukprot:354707-Chlamydomonas_euryale.AAC.3